MNQSGITYIDILVTLGVILVLFTVILLTINPVDFQKKGRDNKRISDISLLDRMISEYSLDHKSFPDSLNTTRTSSILPSGNNGPLSKPSDGWIDANLTSYNPVLPIDPKNDATYFYTYRHNASGYELNATLEYLTEYSANDNGNNSNVYEVGNDLTIL
ncbi:type II secretion system protein [candidate division WWE3 bacterium]|nr:type II secretion system protein [candidate division WWE3 bacterium]